MATFRGLASASSRLAFGPSLSATGRTEAVGRHPADCSLSVGMENLRWTRRARPRVTSLLLFELGADPAADRHKRRSMPTFIDFATEFLNEAAEIARSRPAEAKLRLRTIGNYRSLLKRHVGPAIGSMKIDAVRTADIERLHHRLGKKHPATANRCLEFIGSIYRKAGRLDDALRDFNPAKRIAAFKERSRERFLSAAEVVALGDAIREGETIGILWNIDATRGISKHVPKKNQRTNVDPFAAAALRLLVLTGARLREILHAQWDDVDLERAILMVTGKTGRRAVMLPPPAVEILARLPRLNSFVFPGDLSDPKADKPRADLNRPWRAIQRHAKLDGVRIHDLRHSFASFAAAGGASLPMIGRLLGHTQPSTTQRYSHFADDPLRAVSHRVADTVAAALSGKQPADVVPMKREHHRG